MSSLRCIATALLIPFVAASEPPSFEDVLSLRSVGSVDVSPNGNDVLFSMQSTDWKDNRYDSELWIAPDQGAPFQLTRTKSRSSSSGEWSSDGQWIAFLADRGDKTQIYVMRARGGEAQPATEVEEGVGSFRWAPDGDHIIFAAKVKTPEKKKRKDRYGDFAVEDQEHVATQLWRVAFDPAPWPAPQEQLCDDEGDKEEDGDEQSAQDDSEKNAECGALPEPQQLTDADNTVANFELSPDGTKVVYETRVNNDIMSYVSSDIWILDLASQETRSLVSDPGHDGSPQWSPDGRWILFRSDSGNTTSDFYTNGHLKKVSADGGESIRLAADHDEQIINPIWTQKGIYFGAWEKTNRRLYLLNPDNDSYTKVSNLPDQVFNFDLDREGKTLAFSGREADELSELYRTGTRRIRPTALTKMNRQIADWSLGSAEVVSWTSQDGTTIEGVVHKPAGFDPDRQYPLLVAIHGGPTGISIPAPVATYVYPFIHWLDKGAIILQPNYRGSAGYGEDFRSLNVRNLGVGDMWDVMSGVDHLIAEGYVDESRMGAMGWSQGGYISAFLTTNTNRFKAISVGAGISNWMTYYVNTDIHPFTRQYLKGTPWSDPDIYAMTSPMTNIKQAATPTLIQHGEFDRRVPTPNAYELYQGLQDVGVATKLIIYKDFGHGISKPKERLAAVWHNWQWFAEHIWNEEVELPKAGKDEEQGDQD